MLCAKVHSLLLASMLMVTYVTPECSNMGGFHFGDYECIYSEPLHAKTRFFLYENKDAVTAQLISTLVYTLHR